LFTGDQEAGADDFVLLLRSVADVEVFHRGPILSVNTGSLIVLQFSGGFSAQNAERRHLCRLPRAIA
jgi:hypothetical protein